jgi:hypothetical protein
MVCQLVLFRQMKKKQNSTVNFFKAATDQTFMIFALFNLTVSSFVFFPLPNECRKKSNYDLTAWLTNLLFLLKIMVFFLFEICFSRIYVLCCSLIFKFAFVHVSISLSLSVFSSGLKSRDPLV